MCKVIIVIHQKSSLAGFNSRKKCRPARFIGITFVVAVKKACYVSLWLLEKKREKSVSSSVQTSRMMFTGLMNLVCPV